MAESGAEEWVLLAAAENILMAESHEASNERSKKSNQDSQTEGFKNEDDNDKKLSPELGTGYYQSADQRSYIERLKKEEGDHKKCSPELEIGNYQSGDQRSLKLDITNLVISDYAGFKEDDDDDDRERSPELETGSYRSGNQRSYIERLNQEEGDDKKRLLDLETGSYQSGYQQVESEDFKKEHDDDRKRPQKLGTKSYQSGDQWIGGFKKTEDDEKRWALEPGTGFYQTDNRASSVEGFKKKEDDVDRHKKWPSPESGISNEGYEGESEEEKPEKNSQAMADLGRRLVGKLRILGSSDDHAADDPEVSDENFNDILTTVEDLKQDICGSNPQGIPENKKRDLKMKSPMVYDETSDSDLGTLDTDFQELVLKGEGLAMRKSGVGSSKNVEENYESAEENNFRVIQLGVRISRLLVKMMLLLSEFEKELSKFKAFKHSLELINKEDSSTVINKFITIIEMTIIVVGSRSELESSQIETIVDKLLSCVLKNILCLKYFVEQLPGESEYLLDSKMKQCEREIEEMERKVNEFKVLCSGSLWVLDKVETEGKQMNYQIDQVWSKLKD